MTSCRVLLPITILYLCNFFDRSNVGNAKIIGLETDLRLTNHQSPIRYSIVRLLRIYVVADVPSNLFLKKATPRLWLSLLAILWGISVMCVGFVRNFAGFVAVRWLVGIFEGGLYPGSLLSINHVYEGRARLAGWHVSLICIALRGFCGLLASGLSHVPTTSVVDAWWRWVSGLHSGVIGTVLTFQTRY
jgi:MFS family permease